MMEDGKITSLGSTKGSPLRKKVEPSFPREERTNGKPGQYSKLLLSAFAAQVALAVLTFIMLFQIDQIVHGTLYSHGLQFSDTLALPHWAFHRFALGMLLLIIGLNAFLTAITMHRRRYQ